MIGAGHITGPQPEWLRRHIITTVIGALAGGSAGVWTVEQVTPQIERGMVRQGLPYTLGTELVFRVGGADPSTRVTVWVGVEPPEGA